MKTYIKTYNPYSLIKTNNKEHATHNKFFDDYIYVSRKQIGLAMCILNFRRHNEISQREFADLCNAYGKKENVKFTTTDISKYENMKTVPIQRRFQVLLKTMHITEKDIA